MSELVEKMKAAIPGFSKSDCVDALAVIEDSISMNTEHLEAAAQDMATADTIHKDHYHQIMDARQLDINELIEVRRLLKLKIGGE